MSSVIGSNSSSFAFRVALWFNRNLDEELTSDDITKKWSEFNIKNVSHRLRHYRADGVLLCRESPKRLSNGAKELTWSAGPTLFDMADR